MIYIGVDPGLTGAIGAIDDEANLILCADLPVARYGKLAWIDANDLTNLLRDARQGCPARITIERSQSMPGQGVSSTFCIGVVLGSILAACQRIGVPIDLVTSAAWKSAMGLDAQKSTSLDRARLLFPTAELDRKKDHNRAESLCIAEYARRAWVGKAVA
jgi:hypothetical protein